MLEMFGALAALTLWGWAAALGILVFLVLMTENEILDLGIVLSIITVGLVFWWNGVAFWPWVVVHKIDILMYGIGYVFIGVLWSYFKYDRFSSASRRRYDSDVQCNRITPDNQTNQKFIAVHYFPSTYRMTRKLSNWIFGWVFSVIAFFLRDFLTEVADFLISLMRGIYDAIAMRHFKDVVKEVPKNQIDFYRNNIE